MVIDSRIYADYLSDCYDVIHKNGEYITELDAATGDGDHWSNLDKGFNKLNEMHDELISLSMDKLLKKVGMTMMSVIGGSSGILYGGAYIAASKAISGKDTIDINDLQLIMESMLNDMIQRGKAQEGWKTMLDSLGPAVRTFKKCLDSECDYIDLLNKVEESAKNGANATKDMEAVRGRASYQKDKGVGHLDPGAVTMSYQISTLCNNLRKEINNG